MACAARSRFQKLSTVNFQPTMLITLMGNSCISKISNKLLPALIPYTNEPLNSCMFRHKVDLVWWPMRPTRNCQRLLRFSNSGDRNAKYILGPKGPLAQKGPKGVYYYQYIGMYRSVVPIPYRYIDIAQQRLSRALSFSKCSRSPIRFSQKL